MFEYDRTTFQQLSAAETRQMWQPSNLDTLPSRPATVASFYSSLSEDSNSVPDSLDDVFSHQADEEEDTPQSSQSTNPAKNPVVQSSRPKTPDAERAESPEFLLSSSPVYDKSAAPSRPGSPSSTGKLSIDFPSPILSPAHASPASSRPSTRLYRTRSGGLASISELRRRREREGDLLDSVLRGIVAPKKAKVTSRRSVYMSKNESGRWRIHSIQEPWGR
ncbi:hypothetical protein F4777DRAFT_54879 [Nemania sp. FL0916]|nr:hypothetical protein F4777DRAFT_54879 [Nemania sp. FL0916]